MNKKYYGPQTEKAINNFPFSFRLVPKNFIHAIAEIKKAAAIAHGEVGELDAVRVKAIVRACDEIIAGTHDDQFRLPAFQGGAGTSNHMNVNEVVASRATEILADGGKSVHVHANDHVNMSHSTNDVMPSALKIVAVRLAEGVLVALDEMIAALEKKSKEFAKIHKLGRTHMQDAVPTTLGAEFASYVETLKRGRSRLATAQEQMLELNLGGTAIGNAINASPKYRAKLYQQLQKVTKLKVRQAKNMMSQTGSNSDFVYLSQSLTAVGVDLSKIAGDFRLMSSGPKGGFAELILPELQPGSSIMPGKVNPVQPEALSQLYYLITGNNLTIEHAAHGAQLELGVMMPIVTDRIIESFTLAAEMIHAFTEKCIKGLRANEAKIREHLENSTAYATLVSPVIGYDAAAQAVKDALAQGKTFREVVLAKDLLTEKEFDKITQEF